MHANEANLQAYLDRELPAAEQASVMRHLAACAECAAGLDEVRARSSLFSTSVRLLDAPEPVEPALAAFRTRAAERAAERAAVRPIRASETRRALLRAAMLVLGVAAAASAAVPGSPLRAWVADAWRQAVALLPSQPESVGEKVDPAAQPVPAAAAPAAVVGVAILPVDGMVHILLQEPGADVRIRVRLVEGERATVTAAGDPRFLTGPGRLEVIGVGSGEVRIDLPRLLRSAVVEVDGRVHLIKDGDDLRLLSSPAYRTGAEVLLPVE